MKKHGNLAAAIFNLNFHGPTVHPQGPERMALAPCLLATCCWARGIAGVLAVQMRLAQKWRVLSVLVGQPTASVLPLNH